MPYRAPGRAIRTPVRRDPLTIERIEVVAGPFTFLARAAGPPDGPLVLLLHGFPQTSLQWRHQLTALGAAGYRAVAFDQRGYSPGARPPAAEDYAVAHLVADVVAVADVLGAATFDVVGHDWGAVAAWGAAIARPGRVRSLVAVSVPHPGALAAAMRDDADQQRRSAYVAAFRRPGLAEAALLPGRGAGLRALFVAAGLGDRSAVDEYVEVLVQPGALTAALNWYRAASMEDAAGLPPATVPTLFVWGDGDVAIGRAAADACAAHVTGPYRCEVLAGAGHWIPEDAPDALNAGLLEHLGAVSSK